MVIARAVRTPWSHVVADGLTSGAPRPAVQDATWIATRQIGDMVISAEAVKADAISLRDGDLDPPVKLIAPL